MRVIPKVAMIFHVVLFAWVAAVGAGDEGWFGLEVKAEGQGRFWNPVINELIVQAIAAESPAARSRIRAGDRIVSVEGVEVAGKRVKILQPHFELAPGQKLNLSLLANDGERYSVTLTAAEIPTDK